MPRGDKQAMMNYIVDIPSFEIQQKIIDIIEPIQTFMEVLTELKHTLLKILKRKYLLSNGEKILLDKIISLKTDKYDNQSGYFATNSIGELSIDKTKMQILGKKIPSRANLSPQDNSLIISKLIGENKIFYIKSTDKVFSTGFFNIISDYIDYLIGFFLSDDFKNSKIKFSNGTTMVGLNLSGLKKIELKNPTQPSNYLSVLMADIIEIHEKSGIIKDKILSLLVNN